MVREIRFISSWAIVNFIVDNPIDWSDRDLAGLGGPGDRAHPEQVTPMVEMWLRLLNLERGLFTQAEYAEYFFRELSPWPLNVKDALFTPEQLKEGVRAKLYRNVYPSMVDHIYAFALLSESSIFKSIDYDTDADVTKKLDIVLTRHDDRHLGLALRAGTMRAKWYGGYKNTFRGCPIAPFPVMTIELPMKRRGPRSRGAGNKRWYVLEDFKEAIDWAKEGGWHGPIAAWPSDTMSSGVR